MFHGPKQIAIAGATQIRINTFLIRTFSLHQYLLMHARLSAKTLLVVSLSYTIRTVICIKLRAHVKILLTCLY